VLDWVACESLLLLNHGPMNGEFDKPHKQR
jgi:hypothetical protein